MFTVNRQDFSYDDIQAAKCSLTLTCPTGYHVDWSVVQGCYCDDIDGPSGEDLQSLSGFLGGLTSILPSIINAAPGILNGVSGIISASKSPKE